MQEKGYVYILTNPSFREDWVKIGKSSRPVDVRSKELDNTAVPLPFEIYATVKSNKYSYIESSLHKILTDLADKRIRKNREFFNIKPEEAFRYLKLIAEMDDTAEINAPEDEEGSSETESSHLKSNTHLGDYTVETDEIFYLSNGVADGKMKVQNGCEYVVLEGSMLDPKITSSESSIRKSRKEHADSLNADGTVVIRDIIFNTPSGAANFIRGGACNGKTYWRTASDQPLSDFISYRKNNSYNALQNIDQMVQRVKADGEVSLEYMKIFEREEMLVRKGQELERRNTERERQNAEREKMRADAAEREVERLKEELNELRRERS